MPWVPELGRISRKTIVGIRVTTQERALQRQVRQAGGAWDAQQKVWHISYEKVVELGLEDRISVSGNRGEREKE